MRDGRLLVPHLRTELAGPKEVTHVVVGHEIGIHIAWV